MKMFSFLFLAVTFAINAQAAYVPGSQCGLTDKAGDGWVTTKSFDLRQASEERISELPTLTKQQLIIAAKELAGKPASSEIKSTVDAVNYLRNNSVGEDLVIVHFNYAGEKFTHILHYPGDNPYGVIFEQGTRHIVALNSDDSVSCK